MNIKGKCYCGCLNGSEIKGAVMPIEEFFEALLGNTEEDKKEKKSRYEGNFDCRIRDCYVNEEKGTVVIVWKDGTWTKATCSKADKFDVLAGYAIAFTKHFYESGEDFHKQALKLINKNSTKKYDTYPTNSNKE